MWRHIVQSVRARDRSAIGGFAVLSVILLLAALPSAAMGQSLMSEEKARQAIEDRYGVQVLRVEKADRDGIPVFVAKVMNPPGNYNEAFQVNMLVIDRRSGELVPQFRHGASGVSYPGDGPRQVPDDSGPALREGTFR